MVCNIYFFPYSPSELTFGITLVLQKFLLYYTVLRRYYVTIKRSKSILKEKLLLKLLVLLVRQ